MRLRLLPADLILVAALMFIGMHILFILNLRHHIKHGSGEGRAESIGYKYSFTPPRFAETFKKNIGFIHLLFLYATACTSVVFNVYWTLLSFMPRSSMARSLSVTFDRHHRFFITDSIGSLIVPCSKGQGDFVSYNYE